MKPKTVYLALCLPGAVLPYWIFVPWAMDHGLNLRLLVQELFSTRIGAFFGMDVLVSAVALAVFISIERRRHPVRAWWLPVIALLTVGVSLALPLFLYLRESQLENEQAVGAAGR